MNKLGVTVAIVAAVIGLVAISSVSGKHVAKEEFEFEEGEVERPHHPPKHEGHKGPRGPREHHGPKHPRHPPRKHHKPPRSCGHEGGGFEHGGQGGFEGEEGFEFAGGEEFVGEESGFRPGHGNRGRQGSFKGAGGFGGFKKEKEFDAGVRTGSKHSNRNQFAKNNAVVAGEQKAVGGGVSSGEVSQVEGVHKHKNLNNDRLVVKESQRGTEDVDAFRGQSERNDEGHFGASDTKVFGAQSGESGSSDQESEKEFEGDVHKKKSFGAGAGAGAVGGRF